MDTTTIYIGHIDQPYGNKYAATVGRFQDIYLRNGLELQDAFDRAVKQAETMIPSFRINAAK